MTWPRVLTDPLRGRTSLRTVFWVYGVLVSFAYSLLGLFVDPEASAIIRLYSVVGVCLGIWQSVMLWQCAYNSGSRAMGRLVRMSVVAGLIVLPLVLYVVFSVGIV